MQNALESYFRSKIQLYKSNAIATKEESEADVLSVMILEERNIVYGESQLSSNDLSIVNNNAL